MSYPEMRSPAAGGFSFNDSVDERLLRERIIWLEGEVIFTTYNFSAKCHRVALGKLPILDDKFTFHFRSTTSRLVHFLVLS